MPSPFAPLEVVAVVAVVRERNGDSGIRHHKVGVLETTAISMDLEVT